jgi:hypothetical protein
LNAQRMVMMKYVNEHAKQPYLDILGNPKSFDLSNRDSIYHTLASI